MVTCFGDSVLILTRVCDGCVIEVDHCLGVRCWHLGRCENDYENGTFRCICRGHFHGNYCQEGTYRVTKNKTIKIEIILTTASCGFFSMSTEKHADIF